MCVVITHKKFIHPRTTSCAVQQNVVLTVLHTDTFTDIGYTEKMHFEIFVRTNVKRKDGDDSITILSVHVDVLQRIAANEQELCSYSTKKNKSLSDLIRQHPALYGESEVLLRSHPPESAMVHHMTFSQQNAKWCALMAVTVEFFFFLTK